MINSVGRNLNLRSILLRNFKRNFKNVLSIKFGSDIEIEPIIAFLKNNQIMKMSLELELKYFTSTSRVRIKFPSSGLPVR